ncbi:hypothetical protein [Mariprofundus ferrooxydans]|uniref:hypothetical protein n=1 Tax=Mariprofundus ferrooxydans TaxID=314344 RepID=UPI00142F7A1E|nr:hypothetical protein [Mariprofundus ferrooxydans]
MRKFALCVLALIVWPIHSANANPMKASFNQLPEQVVTTVEALNFPVPTFKELGTVTYSQEQPTIVTYEHYRIDEISHNLAKLTNAATSNFETKDVMYDLFLGGFLNEGSKMDHELRLSGTGISAGGLIMLLGFSQMNMNSSNQLRFLPFSSSHSIASASKITKLEVVSGQLFPLNVGNKLVIQRTLTDPLKNGTGISNSIVFEVTRQIEGYLINGSQLPGDVFEITFHAEGAKEGDSPFPKYIFSSHLGWVVESRVLNIITKVVGWN